MMKPCVFKIDPCNIDMELIKRAVEALHNRALVAFPTETVYGLGANALDSKAVAGIFKAKDRPLDDPLIVHISEIKDLYKITAEVPPEAEKLINRFWPGPLTIILKKSELIPEIVTTGLDTVAVRMPSNTIAKKFISIAGVPIAAPSANLFGRPSPTTARHVIDDLNGRIDIVLDGGSTEIGIESTVVEFDRGKIIILRPGGISLEELQLISGEVMLVSDTEQTEKAPGKYPRHYSPKAEVVLMEDNSFQKERVLSKAREMSSQGRKVGIMVKQEHENEYKGFKVKVLGPENDARICAARLFSILREFDSEETEVIIVESIQEKGLGCAVMNRLRKAAGPVA
ncbi:MAG: L-threonylcarbamoyladenylate synthase [Candidatus Omnitrophota bacterium]